MMLIYQEIHPKLNKIINIHLPLEFCVFDSLFLSFLHRHRPSQRRHETQQHRCAHHVNNFLFFSSLFRVFSPSNFFFFFLFVNVANQSLKHEGKHWNQTSNRVHYFFVSQGFFVSFVRSFFLFAIIKFCFCFCFRSFVFFR